VTPKLVCEVAFTEWTREGLLRHPVFRRFRSDKTPEECLLSSAGPPALTPVAEGQPRADRSFTFSNLTKVFWPRDKLTKGDLIEYYRVVSPFLLPYLLDRPLVMTRYPDGIDGKSFFQKNAPGFVPKWLRVERTWDQEEGKETEHIICDDLESLLYVINLGTIPLHIWASRMAQLQRPDWCILDLDPKEAPFKDVIAIARHVHELCEEIELAAYAKTSGSTGLHVLIPLGARSTYEEAKRLGELLAHVVVRELPQISTVERVVAARKGRVYVDFLQNGHGKLIVAPFSVRPLDGAPVSMPIPWRSVDARLSNGKFTVRNALEFLERTGGDSLRPVLTEEPNLGRVLENLSLRLAPKSPRPRRGRGSG
jgi:bifunctional non-homologous end joining protein LigD